MMIFTSCYTIVDRFFVSNYAGESGAGSRRPDLPRRDDVQHSVGMMIGTGGSTCGQDLGRGRPAPGAAPFSLLIIFAFVVGSVLSLGGWFFMEPTACMLGATPEARCTMTPRLRPHDDDLAAVLHPAVRLQSFFVTAGKPSTAFWSS